MEKLSEFKCTYCDQFITEEELEHIRNANAPCKHYRCYIEMLNCKDKTKEIE
jgi:uncharacterized Zn-finger protein